jgi:hypothetical protein
MFTKEGLLLKGVSEAVADEIIAALAADPQDENSLLALQKALDGSDEQTLLKAKGEKKESDGKDKEPDDDEDDKDDYDEKYMKKHMPRYMKENKSAVKKGVKDAGLFADKMEKAIEDIDPGEGGFIELNDLGPYLAAQKEFNEEMLKAVELISGQNEILVANTEKSFSLMQKAAKAQLDQAELVKGFMGTSVGRKGVIADARMVKAGDPAGTFTPEENKLIYSVLMKATKEGNSDAGIVISAFESSGKNANILNKSHKKFIRDLIEKEAK